MKCSYKRLNNTGTVLLIFSDMTVTGVTSSPGLGSPPEPPPAYPKPLKPDLSLEWKDLKIEIKVYGKVSIYDPN